MPAATDYHRPEDGQKLSHEWRALAAKQDSGVDDVLPYILSLLRGTAVYYEAFGESRGSQVPLAVWRDPDSGFRELILDAFHDAVCRSVQEQRILVETADYPDGSTRITIPGMQVGGAVAVSLLLQVSSPSAAHVALTVFQASLGFLFRAVDRQAQQRRNIALAQTSAWVELATRAMEAPFSEEAHKLLVEALRQHLGCSILALGHFRRSRCRVAAVSGTAAFDREGRTVGLLASAMQECASARRPLRWPEPDTGERGFLANVAHEELCRHTGSAGVVSYPLILADEALCGVLITIWNDQAPFSDEARCFLDAASGSLAGLVRILQRSDPFQVRKYGYLLWGRISAHKRLLIKGVVALVMGLVLMPVPLSIRVDCQLEPVERRVVSARFDGVLQATHVRPGDSVAAGDTLARLDDQDLLWREAELRASLEQAERRRDMAMTESSASAAAIQVAQLEVESIRLELNHMQYRRENLAILAPISGVVLAGDLERSTGVPVSQGQPLFEIGPLDKMVVEIKIPSRDIPLIEEGARVRFRLAGMTGRSWQTRVSRIRPRSERSGAFTYFIAEADMPGIVAESNVLRAGMNGKASVYSRWRPLGWVMTRRLFDFIHVMLFW